MTVYNMQTHFHPQSTGTVAATNENLSPSGDLVSESIVNTNSNGNGITTTYTNDNSHSTLQNNNEYPCDNSNSSGAVDDIVATKDSMVVTSGAGDATSVSTSRTALPLMGPDTPTPVSVSNALNNISRDQNVMQNHQVQQANQSSQQNTSQQQMQPATLPLGHPQQTSPQQSQMHSNSSQSQLMSQQQHFQHHPDHHPNIQQARQHVELQQGQNMSQTGQLPSFAEITGGNIGSPSQFIHNPNDILCTLDIDSKGSFRSMSHLQNQHQQQGVPGNMQLPVNSFANASQSSSLSPSSTSVANQQALSYATSLMKEMSLKEATSGGQTTTNPGQYHMQNTTANGFFGRSGGDPLTSFFPNDGLGRSMDKPDAKLAATSVLWSNAGPDIGSGNIPGPGLQGVGFPSGNCANNNTSFFNTSGEVGMQSQQGGPPHSHHQQAQYAISSVYPGSKRAITGGHNLMAGHHGGRSAASAQFGGSGNMLSGGGGGAGRHFAGGGGHTGGSRNYSGSNIWTLALQNQRMGNPPAPMNVIGAALNVQGTNSNAASTPSNNGHGGRSGGSGGSYPNMFNKRHRPLPPHKQFELSNAVAATATNASCMESTFSELSPASGPHNSLSGLTTPDGGPTNAKGFENIGKFGPNQHQTSQSSTVENVQFYEDLFRGAGFDGHTAAANFMNTNFMNATGNFEGDMTASHIPSAAAALPGYLNPGLIPNNMASGPPQTREERYSRKVFVGGLPPDIDEEEITNAFRRFGPLVVDWPHKAESKTFFPPKGYCFLLFQDEMSVQHLIEACVIEDQKYYWCVSSPTMKDKAVQIRPWNLADSDYVMDGSQPLDPRKTIFVGGVPRPLRALELAMIMDRLYGGVCYAGIDTDPELKYPKGAGRVAFSNQQSYIAAISARFVQLQHNDIDKRVEVKPYVLDDQMCDECQGSRCQGKFAPFFCANVMCLQYYCEQCWAHIHSRPGREFHKPLVKEGADRPRTMNFRW